MAATALLATSSLNTDLSKAEDSPLGGLKEWTSDQKIDEKSTLDEDAQKAADKAKKSDVCIPIGEGENCW